MERAQEIQQRALVIDGLSYYSDGYTGDLRTGGIDALNVTVCHFEAGYREACDRIAGWLARTAAPESEWRLVGRRSDLAAANRRLWSGISSYGDAFGHDIPARYPADANSHAKLPNITSALVAHGRRDRDIEAYLGGNIARAFGEIWRP